MLTAEEKGFFASIAWGASKLSGCGTKEGAVLVQGRKILSYGYNRKIIPDKQWEMSATLDTLFGSKDVDITGTYLFLTRFPRIYDMKLILASGVASVYFFGEIDDSEAVQLANIASESSISLEIIKLEGGKN